MKRRLNTVRGMLVLTLACSGVAAFLYFPGNDLTRSEEFANRWTASIDRHFAGDEACKQCHQAIFAAHQRSGHSDTLRLANYAPLAHLHNSQFLDSQRGYSFEFEKGETGLRVTIPGHLPGMGMNVDWILGSGKIARTGVSLSPETGRGLEHRWTTYGPESELALTPAHADFSYDSARPTLEAFGRPLEWSEATRCLGCHSTAVPPNAESYQHDLVVPNVTCERCHGPRKEHALLAKVGQGGEKKPIFEFASAEKYLETCSQCHRGEQHLNSSTRAADLVRFQPLGLKRSRCFTESTGTMTCSTCHDPHDEVSHDRATYSQVCMSCHERPRPHCPGDQNSDCIECHMQKSRWERDIYFHDHHIKTPAT